MANFVFAQNHTTFRQLSINQGLSQNSVISIAQDSTGYLWMATQDGLNKYDGRTFKVYDFQFEDITNYEYSHLGKVYVDRVGTIWIIPISRIPHYYDPTLDVFLPLSAINDVSAIYQDSQHNFWFGTYHSGLYRMRKEDSHASQLATSEKINTVYSITEDAKGRIWISGEDSIMEYNTQTEKFVPHTPKTDIKTLFSAIAIDGANQVWVGSYGNGLWKKQNDEDGFEKVMLTEQSGKPFPEDLYVLSLVKDSQQNLWIGTYGSGLYKFDLEYGTLENFSVAKHNPRTIHYDDILSIYEDYTGTLWFGTDGAGVSYHDAFLDKFNYFTNYFTPENVNIDVVRAITIDHSENIWIGTSGKGLSCYDAQTKSWKTYFADEGDSGLSDDRIMSLFTDASGDIWIGTQDGGLNILSKDRKITKYLNHPTAAFPGVTIWRIHKDPNNQIWLGTRKSGIFLFDKKKGVMAAFSAKLGNFPSNNIRTIIDGDNDTLWIGTDDHGVFRFNTKTYAYKPLEISEDALKRLSQFQVKALTYDQNKVLWIGTGGDGLKAYNTQTKDFYRYTTENGLANNVIYAVMQDNMNNLWLSSNKGIIKFRPNADLSPNPEVTNYTNYDGLSNEFNTGAYFKAVNGDLYFGALDGIYWFDPSQMKESHIIPKTVITSFEIFNEPQPLQNGRLLNANQNTLTFGFSSMQFSLPEKNKYQFILEGYETDWLEVDNRAVARYTNLPFGDYVFKVKSSNYDGTWNETPAVFSFTIKKPWYLSASALALYVLLFGLLGYATYFYFKSRWKMQTELKIESDRSGRLKQLNDYKTKLYINLSHEFRTPLTLISAPVKKLLGHKNIPEDARADLSLVARNSDRLMSLVDQLLELSKVESGFVKLRVTYANLELFLNAQLASFIPLAIEKKITLTPILTQIQYGWYDSDVVEKILSNLLGNAIKYTPKQGTIRFEAQQQQDVLEITIENELSEIKEPNIDKLFERFYQSDTQNEGFGIGLSLIKELVALHRGTISASYVNENRIRFQVRLPIAKTCFLETELIPLPTEISPSEKLSDYDTRVSLANKAAKMILLVEDNPELRAFTKTLFENDYKVIEAENGTTGIKKAIQYIPDLIISDIIMPETDGIILCQTLKNDERTSHIPIILLTAKSGEESELIGLQTGADDYILKPYNPNKIKLRVQKLIESRINLRNRYQQNAILKPHEIFITSTDEKFFTKLQQVIADNLANPDFNAAAFSKAIGMSRMQLHRKLMALTGLSATAFITTQRLKSAIPLLQKNTITVAEVAYACGFSSPSYFIKCFKETYGKTPSKFMMRTSL
ncbi:two-component regulator propeller domain-containing protein [Arenibacter sp. GZD96]|uniref:two-component regulator propeller domain-containing protein n=1 Tax=Aurantibrevibacter litoralis TaxID=3106030 RepID=UPI002AFDC9EF|nr:two-component regulator propeller domain-containing protein [Arenibacter sp. GZD-96]MEA1787206.1 two-component regulator propeller domain-containing protein [Arenibacter sp. GZD-96]